jgi:hypothetical protein
MIYRLASASGAADSVERVYAAIKELAANYRVPLRATGSEPLDGERQLFLAASENDHWDSCRRHRA